MSPFKKVVAVGFAVAFVAGTVSAQRLLWDNNITTNGSSGRATSPPEFPIIRVADDVIFGSATVWGGINVNNIEDAGWVSSGQMTIDVWSHNPNGGPLALLASRVAPYVREDQNQQFFGRDDFIYRVDLSGDPFTMAAGHYWIVVRDAGGGGAGTTYWMTSDGGPDGAGTDTGWFSVEISRTWAPEGAIFHHAFEVESVPAPGALAPLGLGGLAGARRRRR